MGRKPLWKVFYLEGGTAEYDFFAAMEDYAGKEYVFRKIGEGTYETNIPYSELRAIARMVEINLPDHVSDTLSTKERAQDTP